VFFESVMDEMVNLSGQVGDQLRNCPSSPSLVYEHRGSRFPHQLGVPKSGTNSCQCFHVRRRVHAERGGIGCPCDWGHIFGIDDPYLTVLDIACRCKSVMGTIFRYDCFYTLSCSFGLLHGIKMSVFFLYNVLDCQLAP
jgi:hypothetical protein